MLYMFDGGSTAAMAVLGGDECGVVLHKLRARIAGIERAKLDFCEGSLWQVMPRSPRSGKCRGMKSSRALFCTTTCESQATVGRPPKCCPTLSTPNCAHHARQFVHKVS